jgi:hypothetical protein
MYEGLDIIWSIDLISSEFIFQQKNATMRDSKAA